MLKGQLIFLWGVPLYLTSNFLLDAFAILYLSLIFGILIEICLGVALFGFIFILLETLSWTWMSVSFPGLGKFSAIIISNKFSAPFSLSPPSKTPIR